VLRSIKIKAHSKLDALEKVGKNLRLFTDKLEVSGSIDIASRLSAARRRVSSIKETHSRNFIKQEKIPKNSCSNQYCTAPVGRVHLIK
jgi:hypothetical protein